MTIVTQNTKQTLRSIRTSLEGPAFQKSLFTLWANLEEDMETHAKFEPTSPIDGAEDLAVIDDIIDAQDRIADVAFQSQASTYEGLLYKLGMWRLDCPDFNNIPDDADRKDRIVYSVFRDLVNITGVETVKTKIDKSTHFFESATDLTIK